MNSQEQKLSKGSGQSNYHVNTFLFRAAVKPIHTGEVNLPYLPKLFK